MSIKDEVLKFNLELEALENDTLIQLFSELQFVKTGDKTLLKNILKTLLARNKMHLLMGGKNDIIK